jgi:hypothetical protein
VERDVVCARRKAIHGCLPRPSGNPKEARFSEREYGRFGSYFERTIEKDKPLTVNYRLWLQEGLMQPEEVAALSNNFLDPVKVTVHELK